MTISNLAQLLASRQALNISIGVEGTLVSLTEASDIAAKICSTLLAAGFRTGDCIAMVDSNTTEYLIFWIACQFAGLRVALVNPHYPPDLISRMLEPLRPAGVASSDSRLCKTVASGSVSVCFKELRQGSILLNGTNTTLAAACSIPGLNVSELSCAGYMHTSGTTGVPKFCIQSHRYFVRLAEFVANGLSITGQDRVFTPLPMYHINPFGYGFLGALFGGAHFVTATKFSASGFWDQVMDQRISVLVMHGAPVDILKRPQYRFNGRAHSVRAMFWADCDFMSKFNIPLAVSGYGSTEAGGLTHSQVWRQGDSVDVPEGMSRYAGFVRSEVECKIDQDGQILLRGIVPGVLFDGYEGADSNHGDGWFETGDIGRLDDRGRLIFIERKSESIRIKGEYVPVQYVEQMFGQISAIKDLALWKLARGDLDEVVLYAAAEDLPIQEIIETSSRLPTFMRPTKVAVVDAIPRDQTTGKIQRRRLVSTLVSSWHDLI